MKFIEDALLTASLSHDRTIKVSVTGRIVGIHWRINGIQKKSAFPVNSTSQLPFAASLLADQRNTKETGNQYRCITDIQL
jgi:hypothetical protein